MFTPLLLCLRPQRSVRLEPNGVDANESRRVARVVVEVIPAALDVHTGQVGVVKSVRTRPPPADDVPLVQLQLDDARDVLLAERDRVPDQVHLGREPEPVVAKARELARHVLGDALDLPVHAYALEVHVRLAEEGAAGRLVDAAGFDAHEPVLDDVYAADGVGAGDLVRVHEELERVRLTRPLSRRDYTGLGKKTASSARFSL